MWARPRLCPGFWGSIRCRRWRTLWAALVLHLLIFQHWSFSVPITCCCCGCFHGVRFVRFVRCDNSYRTSQTWLFFWWYAGIWSSASVTWCWSSWSRSHVTRPSRNPCCRAWAECQTRTVITRDQDAIRGFYGCGLLGGGSAGRTTVSSSAANIIWEVLPSHLRQESHGNLRRMQLWERGDRTVRRFSRTNVRLIKICKTLHLVLSEQLKLSY